MTLSGVPQEAGGLPWIHRHPRLHRNVNRAMLLTLVLFAAGQVFLRTTDFLPMEGR